jgi:hypothetical protein
MLILGELLLFYRAPRWIGEKEMEELAELPELPDDETDNRCLNSENVCSAAGDPPLHSDVMILVAREAGEGGTEGLGKGRETGQRYQPRSCRV